MIYKKTLSLAVWPFRPKMSMVALPPPLTRRHRHAVAAVALLGRNFKNS